MKRKSECLDFRNKASFAVTHEQFLRIEKIKEIGLLNLSVIFRSSLDDALSRAEHTMDELRSSKELERVFGGKGA